MKITVIGSHLCSDTMNALERLRSLSADTNFRDILSSHECLLDYLKLRDTDSLYDKIRGTERLGIPCFILENGDITLDIEDVIKSL